MYSESNSTIMQPSLSVGQRVRNELQVLFGCFHLRGKISVLTINAPQQIEVSLSVPLTTKLFSQNKQVSLLFKFGENYPNDPPSVFLTSDLLSSQNSYIDIVNPEEWTPSSTIVHIVNQFMKKTSNQGLINTLKTIFPSTHQIQSSYRHIQEQNNKNIQPLVLFNGLNGAFTCFKPISKTQCPSEKQSTKSHYIPTKYKKKQHSDIKFYEIGQKKQNLDDKISEEGKKREAKPMNKNANLPKFLIRIFIKYIDRFRHLYKTRKEYEKLQVQCRKMKDWKKHDKKQHAFGLKHLKRFFQDDEEGYPSPGINRQVIIEIIGRYLLEEICENSQIPSNHRVGYLVACKVYSLRCRNAILAGRIQSK